jgi:hypothetical protein
MACLRQLRLPNYGYKTLRGAEERPHLLTAQGQNRGLLIDVRETMVTTQPGTTDAGHLTLWHPCNRESCNPSEVVIGKKELAGRNLGVLRPRRPRVPYLLLWTGVPTV